MVFFCKERTVLKTRANPFTEWERCTVPKGQMGGGEVVVRRRARVGEEEGGRVEEI